MGGEVRDEGIDGMLLEVGSGDVVVNVIRSELRKKAEGGFEGVELVEGCDGIAGIGEVGGSEVEVGHMFGELVQGRQLGAEFKGEAVEVLVSVHSEGERHGVDDGAGGEKLRIDEGV